FEPHKDDIYELNESSGTSMFENTLQVPNMWWDKLFELLERYNFTIDENTSMDVELSVDPEMLGRIFENLLAEINPVTGETARKSTGSYYTPRPIVEYMVDESLKQYLLTKTNIHEDKLQQLLSYSEEVAELSGKETGELIDALDAVKIIDPACGSGAFPMGILQKMVLVLQKVDPQSKNWRNKQLKRIPDLYLRNIVEKQLKDWDVNYIRKRGIIENSIYGIDSQQIAVEISKLRVFLSLVVDSNIRENETNLGIRLLPNLEFKFVCADSLIGLKKQNGMLFEADDEIKELKTLRARYFHSSGDEKHRIETMFKETQKRMYLHAEEMGSFGGQTLRLSDWDPFSGKSMDWFDSQWMFGVDNCFDIVIGNPPY
ncbi:MAG: class I SAM-dependent DNA methyltransferase, partial [bacterium]|nr:class I SAM-dependent DNA methyltransferase [bacterium]